MKETYKKYTFKPCALCGKQVGDDLIDVLYPSGIYWREHSDGFRSYHSLGDRMPGDNYCWSMNCTENMGGCGMEVTGDTEEEAVAKWNRRPSDE